MDKQLAFTDFTSGDRHPLQRARSMELSGNVDPLPPPKSVWKI